MLEGIVSIVVLSVILEYIVKVVNPIIPIDTVGKVSTGLILAMFFGVGVALLTGSDIFSQLGYVLRYPIAGEVMTGLLLSGGSGFIHELFQKLRASREDVIIVEE